MDRPLSTAEVARLLGLDERRVRELVRSGLCRPARHGRRYAFSFQDLVVLRAAKALLDAHVPAARIRRALAALARELPEGCSLSGLRIFADGRDVAVRDGGPRWQPATGQTLLEFEVDGLAELVERSSAARARAPLKARRAQARRLRERRSGSRIATPWLRRRLSARARARPGARRRLREPRPALPRERRRPRGRAALSPRARAAAPTTRCCTSISRSRSRTRRSRRCDRALQRALALDPEFADAHYNVAGLYEQARARRRCAAPLPRLQAARRELTLLAASELTNPSIDCGDPRADSCRARRACRVREIRPRAVHEQRTEEHHAARRHFERHELRLIEALGLHLEAAEAIDVALRPHAAGVTPGNHLETAVRAIRVVEKHDRGRDLACAVGAVDPVRIVLVEDDRPAGARALHVQLLGEQVRTLPRRPRPSSARRTVGPPPSREGARRSARTVRRPGRRPGARAPTSPS